MTNSTESIAATALPLVKTRSDCSQIFAFRSILKHVYEELSPCSRTLWCHYNVDDKDFWITVRTFEDQRYMPMPNQFPTKVVSDRSDLESFVKT